MPLEEDNSTRIEVQVLGKPYTVMCSPDERIALFDAVHFLNNKLNAVQAATNIAVQNRDHLVITTAINLAHELLSGKKDVSVDSVSITAWEEKIDVMLEHVDAALK